MTDDLWGEIAIDTQLELPIAILKRQAELLEKKTGGVLDAQVHSMKMTGKDSVGYSFNIVAPALSDYVHKVLTISHPGILLYPVRLVSHVTDADLSCKDEEEFVNALREILSSGVVHKAVLALITQSRAAGTA
jgi:hypothetical protein